MNTTVRRALVSAAGGLAGAALVAGTALAYVQVPPGAAPPPPVPPTKVVVTMAPQPVKRVPVKKGQPQTFSYHLFSSNPTQSVKVVVHVLPHAFITSGKVVFAVSNPQNLATIQKTIGSSETVLAAFEMVTKAYSIKPMVVNLTSPGITGEISVFALRPNGTGQGYHYIYVQPKIHGNTISFVVNRNEPYVIVVKA